MEYAEFVMEVVKPLSMRPIVPKPDRQHGYDWFLSRRQYISLSDYTKTELVIWFSVFSSANWLHQEAFNYIERKKLSPEQRIFIYAEQKQMIRTRPLMAGNIKQAYIDSSLRYYRDLIAGGIGLDNLRKVQSGAIHRDFVKEIYQTVSDFCRNGVRKGESQCILKTLATGVATQP